MKVAHFCTNDAVGGAARASSRLHQALVHAGCDSRMVVLNKTGDDERTNRVVRSSWHAEARQQLSSLAQNALLYRYRADEVMSFEYQFVSAPTAALIEQSKGMQVVNLHWTRGLVTSGQARRIAEKTGARLVWTLMDFAMLTGGCHYMHGCTGYQRQCGHCPRIRSSADNDLTRRIWRKRKRSFTAAPPTIVACNRWTRDLARQSSLLGELRCEVIPLAIDLRVYRPIPRPLAREVLGLPANARIMFCGALKMGQARKGMPALIEALRRLPQHLDAGKLTTNPVLLLTAGQGDFAHKLELPFQHHHLGLLGDDRSLALAYSAADLFVSPSIEDAGPMMVNESLACGTPVVAFAIGTAADQVEPDRTGWLASPGDAEDLSRGIARVLDSDQGAQMRDLSRKIAEANYSPDLIARRYLDLYADLTSQSA